MTKTSGRRAKRVIVHSGPDGRHRSGGIMSYELTLAILKPGILQRRIIGEIIDRIERKGLQIQALKLTKLDRKIVETHYAEHEGRDFYPPLLEYMTSGPVVAMVLAGENAIQQLRKLAGATNPDQAEPGSIRGDYAQKTNRNIIHASDSPESSAREIKLFFRPEEIIEYEDDHAKWIYKS